MVGEDRVMMSGKDLRRVHVIRQVVDRTLTQVEAARLLGLTDRQIRRLIRQVEQAGDQGLVHRGRGKPSNRRIAAPVKAKVLRLYAAQYGDFGPTLAAEKLAERHGITISAETLRGGAAGARSGAFSTSEAAASSVAGAQNPCRRVGPAGRLTP
jgi:hypothetical protein